MCYSREQYADDSRTLDYTGEASYGTHSSSYAPHSAAKPSKQKYTTCVLASILLILVLGAIGAGLWFGGIFPDSSSAIPPQATTGGGGGGNNDSEVTDNLFQILQLQLSGNFSNHSASVQVIANASVNMDVSGGEIRLIYENKTIAELMLPNVNSQLAQFESNLTFNENLTLVSSFLQSLLKNDSKSLIVSLESSLTLMSNQIQAWTQNVSLPRGLQNVQVTYFNLTESTQSMGANAIANGSFIAEFNTSGFLLVDSLGNFQFNMSYNGTFLGSATVYNARILQGINSWTAHVTTFVNAETAPILGKLIYDRNQGLNPIYVQCDVIDASIPLLSSILPGLQFDLNIAKQS